MVGGVRRDGERLARRALLLLAPLVALIGVLAAMLPGPVLAGDTAAIVAVTVPLLASLAAAAFALTVLVTLVFRAAAPTRAGSRDRIDLLPHWLEIDLPHRPEQPRAPGRR